jgi:hypothetical protein
MADLCPEASNAFKLPLFEISILKNKKRHRTLVQILSHGGARGVCYVLPQSKNHQMTSLLVLVIRRHPMLPEIYEGLQNG